MASRGSIDFVICALFYGDYPQLAARLLSSLQGRSRGFQVEFRFGLNAVGGKTQQLIKDFAAGVEEEVLVYPSPHNIYKYPMMRLMFFDQEDPLNSTFVMWFDDDTFISPDASKRRPWLEGVYRKMRDADVLGPTYLRYLEGRQADWIADQRWFGGMPLPLDHRIRYPAGGWWCMRTEVVAKYDWPWAELRQRGGMEMLGELCRQQQLRLTSYRAGIVLDADLNGNPGKMPSRGLVEEPIGYSYEPGVIRQAAIIEPPIGEESSEMLSSEPSEAPDPPPPLPSRRIFNPGL